MAANRPGPMAFCNYSLIPVKDPRHCIHSYSRLRNVCSPWYTSIPSPTTRRASILTPPRVVVAATADIAGLYLPDKLRTIVNGFAAVPSSKLRYQQLLHYAKQLPPMDPSLRIDENLVHGCTSVVHVLVQADKDSRVHIVGDSDSQLTKGLVALLVNGLSGCTPEEVLAVDPSFIVASGLSVSLTPSRNNGFVNMVAKIKDMTSALSEQMANSEVQAHDIADEGMTSQLNRGGDAPGSESVEIPDRPVYSSMLRKIRALEPTEMEITDNSHLHAGHAGANGLSGESHFSIRVVSNRFNGIGLVERHRLIYALLAEEMKTVHALNIETWTSEEAGV